MNRYNILLTAALTLGMPQIHQGGNKLLAETLVKQTDAYKATLNVFTYDADGKLLGSTTGVMLSPTGIAASAYSIFAGAVRAEVIDYKGKRYEVKRILGASSDYDLIRFQVDGIKKSEFLNIASAACVEGTQLSLQPYSTNKKNATSTASITKDEAYGNYRYYTLSIANDTENFSLPLIDSEGQLVAFVQKNVGKNATTACAIDARFLNDLHITALSAINRDLRAVRIAKALPGNAKKALDYIYMLPASDSTTVSTAYADFIESYPEMPDGFLGRASLLASRRQYAQADADIQTALKLAGAASPADSLTATDAVHYQYSDLMFRAMASRTDSAQLKQVGWTYAHALEEAQKAYESNPLALYLLQQGRCLFADKHYQEAHAKFLATTKAPGFASSDTYYWAARSLELANGDAKEVLALLDSAVNAIPQPVNARNAQYYLERSQRLILLNRYRDAVMNYNEYEKAVGPRNLNEQFYYLRHSAEMQAHMYQQALDDIRTAISTAQHPLPYRLEEALVLLQVGEFQQAIDAATKLLKDLPESPDCYKIIGIAYGELGKKALAQQNLQKAKSLGDDTVDPFIQKYK